MTPIQLARVVQAYQLCAAYANPLRHGMELSSTERDAVKRAATVLKLARAS